MAPSVLVFVVHAFRMGLIALPVEHAAIVAIYQFTRILHAELLAFLITTLVTLTPHAIIVATKLIMQMAQSAEGNAGPTVPYAVRGEPVTYVAMAVLVLVFVGTACPTTLFAFSTAHATIVATQPIL